MSESTDRTQRTDPVSDDAHAERVVVHHVPLLLPAAYTSIDSVVSDHTSGSERFKVQRVFAAKGETVELPSATLRGGDDYPLDLIPSHFQVVTEVLGVGNAGDDDGTRRVAKNPRTKRSAAERASNVAKIDELLAKAKSRPPKKFDPKAPMPF